MLGLGGEKGGGRCEVGGKSIYSSGEWARDPVSGL
jgi:hypothetical protein